MASSSAENVLDSGIAVLAAPIVVVEVDVGSL